MPPFVLGSVVSRRRSWSLALALPWLSMAACDTDTEDGLFGASAAGPAMPGSAGGSGGDEDEDPDTEGASGGARAESEGSSGAAETGPVGSGPADSNADPVPPPPAEDSGGTFDPLDDGGMDSGGSTSLGDDGAMDSGGGGLPSSCCAAGVAAGCSDPAVEACVCGQDPFCCDTQWDDLCAMSADACGGNCGGGGGGGGCCMVQATPGCADPAIENCVCVIDAFCCTMQWDDICVQEAQVDCGAAC
jgi:hypothetical protein